MWMYYRKRKRKKSERNSLTCQSPVNTVRRWLAKEHESVKQPQHPTGVSLLTYWLWCERLSNRGEVTSSPFLAGLNKTIKAVPSLSSLPLASATHGSNPPPGRGSGSLPVFWSGAFILRSRITRTGICCVQTRHCRKGLEVTVF